MLNSRHPAWISGRQEEVAKGVDGIDPNARRRYVLQPWGAVIWGESWLFVVATRAWTRSEARVGTAKKRSRVCYWWH